MDRTPPAGITLSREIRAPHTVIPERAKLHALKVKRALKGIQLEPSAPELSERHARLRENQRLNLIHLREMLQVIVTLVSSREQEIEMGG